MTKSKINVQRSDDADAFIRESEHATGLRDDLALRLAEEYLRTAANGDDGEVDAPEELLAEEFGGPFLESRPEDEFGRTITSARGGDTADVEPSALPEAVGSLALASPDEEIEAAEERWDGSDDGDDDSGALDGAAEAASRLAPRFTPERV